MGSNSADVPPEKWRRFATSDEAETQVPEPSLQDPVAVGMMFCNALDDPQFYLNALRNLSTPESVRSWGDYALAAQALRDIPEIGYGNRVNFAEGDDKVCYFKILSGVSKSYEVLDDQIVSFACVLTLVWRSEYGRWMVHAMGDYLRPEDVPH